MPAVTVLFASAIDLYGLVFGIEPWSGWLRILVEETLGEGSGCQTVTVPACPSGLTEGNEADTTCPKGG